MPQPPSIEERLAAFERTGDDQALWPHVSRAGCHAAQRALVRLSAEVLANPAARPRLTARSDAELSALGVVAFRSGVGPLAGWWLAHGQIDADPGVAKLLERHLAFSRQRAQVLERALLDVVDRLAVAGVNVTLLKGAHTAHAHFPAPETRPAADLDLLVAPESFEAAAGALRVAGYLETRRTNRPARSEWILGSQRVRSLDVEHPENPWGIDLHRSLERHYFRGIHVSFEPSLWQTTELEVGGRRVRGLAQPLLVTFLALHTSRDVPSLRLLRLVELVLVIRRSVADGSLAWEDLARLLEHTDTERFVYPALELAERLAPGTLDGDFRARLNRQATPRLRRVVEGLWKAGIQPPARSLDGWLMWARGPIEMLGRIAESVWPSDDVVTMRALGRVYARRWRRLVALLR